MTDQSQQDRLAALAARKSKPATPPPPVASEAAAATAEPSRRSWRPTKPSTTRVAATSASLVSFAAMVVAMGPLTANAAETASAESVVEDPFDSGAVPPTQPQVVIEVIPNYVSADGTPLTPDELALVTNELLAADPADLATGAASSLDTSTQQADPASAPAPTAPATAAATPTTAPPVATAPAAAPATAAPAARRAGPDSAARHCGSGGHRSADHGATGHRSADHPCSCAAADPAPEKRRERLR